MNVIAPIMTDPKGAAWRQTIYYPYYFASIHGRGTALQLNVKCPGYDADVADNVPWIDIAGVHDEGGGMVTFFAVNRHASETLTTEVNLQGFGPASVIDHQEMTHTMLEAVNTATDQTNVAPQKGRGAKIDGGTLTLALKPHSYTMIRLKLG